MRDSGKAQFVDVNDNPRARARMSGIMASVAIERFTGVETIPHLTPRDMTLAGLESLLLGAHAEGVRNILSVTGDPPESGDYPGKHGVYEVDSIGLVELMARLNRGEDFHGRAIDAPTSFFPGVAVNPTADDLELEADRFQRKVAAGARFAMTQILFGLEPLEAFRNRIGGAWPIPVLVGVWPIRTYEPPVREHNETPGHRRPRARAGALPPRGGERARGRRELGHELTRGARALAHGVYVVAPFRAPMNVVDSCRLSIRARAGRDRPLSRAQSLRDDRGRHAVAGRRAEPGGEDRRLRTTPRASTAGPPELPWCTCRRRR